MKKLNFVTLFLGLSFLVSAQLPKVDLPIIPIPEVSIYLAPNGKDSNDGSEAKPMKTFFAAMQKINFGTPAIDNGNFYGEVVLKAGNYYPLLNTGFFQTLNQWRKPVNGGFVYRNVSIRGEGEVTIHGDSMSTNTQLIYLRGNGIKISNLNLKNLPLHGVFLDGNAIKFHHDVLVDQVNVDGAIGFGIVFFGYERILTESCKVSNTCLSNKNELNNTCQWASGLKTEHCDHVTFRNNKVNHNWGEGVNTSYSRYVHVHDNIIWDNYSVNLYLHSASNGVFSHNLIYNSDSTIWRYCYGSGGISGSLSISNELTCTNACFFNTYNCNSKKHCCSNIDYDNIFPQISEYYLIDSVFIFNNILLGSDIQAWDAFSSFLNFGNLSNIFIEHNTVIGCTGNDQIQKSPISFISGTGFLSFENNRVRNNIFSADLSLPKTKLTRHFFNNGICNGNWKEQLKYDGNLWLKGPIDSGLNFDSDFENSAIPTLVEVTELSKIEPNMANNPALVQAVIKPDYILDDFYHIDRSAATNLGAVEIVSSTATSVPNSQSFKIYPNPSVGQISIQSTESIHRVQVFDLLGRGIVNKAIDDQGFLELDLKDLATGCYFVQINEASRQMLIISNH